MIGGFLLSIPWNYKAVTATYQEIDSKVYENKLISTAEEIEGYDYIIFIQGLSSILTKNLILFLIVILKVKYMKP